MTYQLIAKIEVSIKSPYADDHQYAGKIMFEDVDFYIIEELKTMQIECDELEECSISSFEVVNGAILFDCRFEAFVEYHVDQSDIEEMFKDNLITCEEI